MSEDGLQCYFGVSRCSGGYFVVPARKFMWLCICACTMRIGIDSFLVTVLHVEMEAMFHG